MNLSRFIAELNTREPARVDLLAGTGGFAMPLFANDAKEEKGLAWLAPVFVSYLALRAAGTAGGGVGPASGALTMSVMAALRCL